MTVSAEDGAATVSPVAVALNGCSVRVKELTLRTPSLDDVFLELTGNRIESVDGAGEEHEDEPASSPQIRGASMTDVAATVAKASAGGEPIRAAKAGFVADVISVGRAGRAVHPAGARERDPALIVPLFFFIVNIGSLQKVTESFGHRLRLQGVPAAGGDHLRGHRHVSRASTLVTDIQDGYFDRLTAHADPAAGAAARPDGGRLRRSSWRCPSPSSSSASRWACASRPGCSGVVVFILLAGAWGLVFTGFPYAIALKTGNPAAVNSSFILFFPFAFLTTSFLPQERAHRLAVDHRDVQPGHVPPRRPAVAGHEGMGLDAAGQGLAAVAGVGLISFSLALAAFRGRLNAGA